MKQVQGPESLSRAPFDRPRERLQALGSRSLSDAELVALVLRTGGAGRDALAVSQSLLDCCGGLRRVAGAAESELASVPGLGLEGELLVGHRAAGLAFAALPKKRD